MTVSHHRCGALALPSFLRGILCSGFLLFFFGSAVNAQEAFINSFQTYVDLSKDALESCDDAACLNTIDFPVIRKNDAGELVYWNDAAIAIDLTTTGTIIESGGDLFLVYEADDNVCGFIPIWYENTKRQQQFLCKELGERHQTTRYTIDKNHTSDLLVGNFLTVVETLPSLGRGHLLAYFLSIVFLFLIVLHYSQAILKLFGDVIGATIVILLLTTIRLIFGMSDMTAPLAHYDIFQFQVRSSFLSPSLGELFLNMLLFFVITIFLFRSFDNRPIRKNTGASRWYFLVSGYLLVMMSIVSFVYVVKRIVIHSAISFQFDKIYVLDWNTHIFILSILLFISALFFLSYLLIRILGSTGANLGQRLLAFFIATLITFPVFINFSLHVSAFGFYILVLSILILMDLFVETPQKSISWLVIWLVTIASGTTALLYSHNSVAHIQKSKLLAQHIAYSSQTSHSSNLNAYNPDNFDWQIIDGNNSVFSYGSIDESIDLQKYMPGVNQYEQVFSKAYRTLIYRHAPGVIVLVGKSHNAIIEFISLFSFLFTSLTIVILLIFLLNLFLNFLPPGWNLKINRGQSIRRRIQYVIFGMLILSFATVFAVTSFYLQNYDQDASSQIKQDLQRELLLLSEWIQNTDGDLLVEFQSTDPDRTPKYNIFDVNGQVLSSTGEDQFKRAPHALTNMNRTSDQISIVHINSTNWISAFKRIASGSKDVIIGVTRPNVPNDENFVVSNLLGTLLNLYIFLFVAASSIALAFSDSITRPLFKLREKLSSVKIGRSNERIDWSSDDEVGQLIADYNRMLEKIEESVNTLAMTEREVAWREMAKQVAHEIKNPLTPMKLSLQHLQLAIKRNPERAEELIARVGKTLLEQIEQLSDIASEFSHFGKMPKPENKKVILNDVASSVHDLFRKREDMDINLYIPIDEIYVFGDRHYMTRVLINLLKNAIQAIPNERRGRIEIHVYKEEENAVIKVSDNGTGIPSAIQDKVFQPNFTSKNSGTGLGLAICANIVESFNGKIYFDTKEHIGTTFFIEIPLMHMADNFKKEEHVIL